jgi:RNA polymerase sigma-70 factor (sigma-E family)
MPTQSADADFTAYVRSSTPGLLRAAYLLTGDQHLAEDLVQNALVRTHRAWHRIREGNPDAYARKVMYHEQIAWWRRRRVPEALSANLPEPRRAAAGDEAGGVVVRLTVREALLRLGPRQRAVLILRFVEDRTEAETAELLGITVGTVKSQTAKALARLRSIAPELVGSPHAPVAPAEGLTR